MAGIMFEKDATCISTAIYNNDLSELKAALRDGENPHYTDRKGNTYLHYLCTMHRPFIFHVIVSTGIDVNSRNRHGNTALHVTALQNECCHVGDLLAAGIDSTLKNRDGKTAAEISTKNIFWKSIYNKYQPGIFEAIANHDVDKVLYLLHSWTRVDTVRDGQTLRQYAASRKFHDLVFHIDVHNHSLNAIYSVLEGDPEKAWTFMKHSKCDINLLNYARESCHILQHAIKLGDLRLIRMICKSRVNVNVRVTVQGYLKAPVFFAAIDPNVSEDIMWTVLKAGADFTLKDERGRNAAVYALDKTNRKIPFDVVAYMLKNGLDVSQRDGTGVTLRDVARFARRRDIVTLIDKAYVKIIRSSNMAELERLAVMGYDSLLIDFNYRDTFIYASGNETDEVVEFTLWLPKFYSQVRKFHYAVHHWSLDDLTRLLTTSDRADLLLNARDKGGRTALHLCVLHWRFDALKMLLSQPNIDINAVDNLGRTAYHYACSVEENDERDEFCKILEGAGVDTEMFDFSNHRASYNLGNADANNWIMKERKTRYGMEKQLACVDKYEELCHMMKYKKKGLKHFNTAVCRFKYSIPQVANILSPLMPEYRDLVFIAMEKDKEAVAVRLIQLGADWSRREWCDVVQETDKETQTRKVFMSVAARAQQLGMDKVVMAIDKKKEYLRKKKEKEQMTQGEMETDASVSSKKSSNMLEKVRKVQRNGISNNIDEKDDESASCRDTEGSEDVSFEEEVVESESDDDEDGSDGVDNDGDDSDGDNYYSGHSFEDTDDDQHYLEHDDKFSDSEISL